MKNPSMMLSLLRWLRARETPMTGLLGSFVRAESPSFDKAAVDRVGQMVAAEWRKRGATIKRLRQPERGDHLRLEWCPNPRRDESRDKNRHKSRNKNHEPGQLLVLGHLDTVYDIGTLKHMPWRVSRGRCWGPGTFDMKAGLVIALYAMDALSAAGFSPEKRIVFLWTSDEEIGSGTSRAAIEAEARRSDAVFVLEPSLGPRGHLKTGRKGVGEIELIATGRAAHAGLNPEDGINAIQEIAAQITRISRWNQPKRGISVSAGVIEGGTRTNVIADRARALVDLRAARVGDMRELERKFHALRPVLAGAKLEVRGGFNRPPLERRMSVGLYAKAQRLAKEMGVTLGEAFVGGGSDGNFTAGLGVPTLDGLGAVGEGAHSPEENISIRSLPERAALLAGLLADLARKS